MATDSRALSGQAPLINSVILVIKTLEYAVHNCCMTTGNEQEEGHNLTI